MPPTYRNSAFRHLLQGSRDRLAVAFRSLPEVRFVLFCQGRTGSSMLESLLASHPEIHRSTEILAKRPPLPNLYRFLDAESRRGRHRVWGTKMKLSDLDRQRVDARGLLERMAERGWRIVHVWRRATLRQAVSHFVRRHRGQPDRRTDAPEVLRLRIEPEELVREIETRLAYLSRERTALAGLPCEEVIYEDDLLHASDHQRTADRLFRYLGVEAVPARTGYRKVTPDDLSSLIENWLEVRSTLVEAGYRELLAAVELPLPSGTVGT